MASGGEDPGPFDVRSHVPTLGVDRSHLMQGSGVHPHDDVQRGGLQQLGAGDREEEIQGASQPERIALHGAHVPDEMVPKFGMEFKSYEMAYAFYNKYAEHVGFDVRKSRSRAAYREICCSREGKNKYRGDETKRERRRGSARIGCRAYVRVRNVVREGEVVSVVFDDVVVEHNHPLTRSPSAVKHMRSHKQRDDTLMEFVDTMQQCRVPQSSVMGVLSDMHGDCETIPFTTRDLENRKTANVREENADDISKLLNFFNECKKDNPKFYWDIKTYEEGVALTITYNQHFLDVPCFEMKGLNHLSGYLRRSRIAWATAVRPRCILTDQDPAMAIAVGRAFPYTIHRLCRWHIIDGHSDHLNTIFMRHKDTETEMMVCINQTYTPIEFEYAWKEFIDKFGLHDSTVLRDLYDIRHRWVPAFFKEDYCGSVPNVKTAWPFAEQLSRVYTRAVFKVFENTLDESVHFRIEQYGVDQTQWIISHSKRSEKHDWCQRQFKDKGIVIGCTAASKVGEEVAVAFERATSVMKGLRNQLEEIPVDVHGLDADDGVSEHEVDVGDGAGPSIHRGGSAGDEISKRPPPKSMTKGRGSDSNETERCWLSTGDSTGRRVDGWNIWVGVDNDVTERLTPSPVMREVDLPPEFRVRGPPMPDWPPPPTESDEERFQEDLEQYYNDGYVSTPCPSPASDLCDSEENLEDEVRKMIIGGMGMCCLRLINKGYSVAAEQAQEGLG
ncbi:Os06g0475800 [Oryza sativa Japonica Group]|uniref:Protein FAR1-RELATED SEQUENCE n=1 Tax=Oryza sativa subsp. japonica TaxID=39947 RepID=Q0DC72_ORYSJ|nr:Os06g0475800 [Oryza sativa Japonica Group]|eukprot:NP_001057637.1 Os06g0475800 [Oryza sativa Japonica Group]